MEASGFQKQIYCKKYQALEQVEPPVWISFEAVTLLQAFEVLFGNNFEHIRTNN